MNESLSALRTAFNVMENGSYQTAPSYCASLPQSTQLFPGSFTNEGEHSESLPGQGGYDEPLSSTSDIVDLDTTARDEERRRQAEQDELDAGRRRQAEREQQDAERRRQAEQDQQDAESRRRAEQERQDAEARRQAELDQREAERRRQAEQRSLEAEIRRQVEQDRREAERRRQTEQHELNARRCSLPENDIGPGNVGYNPQPSNDLIVQLLQAIRDNQRLHHEFSVNEVRQLSRCVDRLAEFVEREPEFPTKPDCLPMNTRQEIEDFEGIGNEEYKKVIKYLAELGGYNFNETVNIILKQTIVDSLSPSLTWQGREPGTMKLQDTKLAKAMYAATATNKAFSKQRNRNATQRQRNRRPRDDDLDESSCDQQERRSRQHLDDDSEDQNDPA